MGVFAKSSSFSCLMASRRSPGKGLLGICEGKVADLGNVAELGVMRGGSVGFSVGLDVLMVGGSRGFTDVSGAVGMMAASLVGVSREGAGRWWRVK